MTDDEYYDMAGMGERAQMEIDDLKVALRDLMNEIRTSRLHPKWAHLSNERTNMLSARMLAASRALGERS